MIVSTQTEVIAARFGEHESIKMLAQTGYDAIDFSMFDIGKPNHPINQHDYKEYAQSLRKTADEYNIVFRQSHAPFPSYKHGDEAFNEKMFNLIIRAMEVTSILGGGIVIVHPITIGSDAQKQKELNMEFYNKLLPYCKKYNVKIALENMWGFDSKTNQVTTAACSTAKEFIEYLDSLDKNWFTACLDIGHGGMKGTGAATVELIHALGRDRLKALHIHDNDAVHDLHELPFTHKLKWDEIMTALKDIGYDGDFTFEADNFLLHFPDELIMSASCLMLSVGRYFVKKYFS